MVIRFNGGLPMAIIWRLRLNFHSTRQEPPLIKKLNLNSRSTTTKDKFDFIFLAEMENGNGKKNVQNVTPCIFVIKLNFKKSIKKVFCLRQICCWNISTCQRRNLIVLIIAIREFT